MSIVIIERDVKPFAADTWSEFLQCVRDARSDLGSPKNIWYRGMSDASFKLIPSLMRYGGGLQKEKDLFQDYERFAARLTDERNSDWELLFDMQHYGVPTRLLDWTDVLGVAIAFALLDSDDETKDCSIHVLDPIRLNNKSGGVNIRRPSKERESDFSYKSVYWDNKPFTAFYPIAIDAPLQNGRMVAQQGSFTIHGQHVNFFDGEGKDCVRKIVLRAGARQGAREFLEHANFNAFSLYPDAGGMARHIVRRHLGSK